MPAELTILVVEDDHVILQLISRSLRSLGYRVVMARDPESALDAVAGVSPDGIILDIRLPVMHGTELLRLLRRPDAEATPAIAITGDADITEADVRARGFITLLRKPFTMSELSRVVSTFIGPPT